MISQVASGRALREADAVVLAREALVQDAVAALLVADVEGRDGVVGGDGVHGAALEHHEGGVVLADGLELRERRAQRRLLAALGEQVVGGRVRLRDHVLLGEVRKRLDGGVRLDDNDLAVLHVRARERIVVLARLDGEAVPDAGDLAAVEQAVLRVPRDRLGRVAPPLELADGTGEVEVEARELAVVAHVAVGREVLIEADDELPVELAARGLPLLGGRGAASCERADRRGREKERRCAQELPAVDGPGRVLHACLRRRVGHDTLA